MDADRRADGVSREPSAGAVVSPSHADGLQNRGTSERRMMVAMWFLLAGLLLLAGCDRVFGLKSRDASGMADVPGAEAGDAGDDDLCFGHSGPSMSGLFVTCLAAAPPETLPPALEISIDTGSGARMGDCQSVVSQADPGGTEVCVIAATTIDLDGALVVRGARPLVLIAVRTLNVSGPIDVSSHRRPIDAIGGGASFNTCSGIAQNGENGTPGGAGGAGGSFATKGGDGGGPMIQNPGLAENPMPIGFVRGGCKGGAGGDGIDSQARGGVAGQSGGALYLIAGDRIRVTSTINASGAGGTQGLRAAQGSGGGGGGGGSGGLIGFDAPYVDLDATAIIVANGGGGGGGGGSTSNGVEGAEPNVSGSFPFPAPGGAAGAGVMATPGGDGGNVQTPDGVSANRIVGGGGGGGGGGGVGHIVVFAQRASVHATSKISPAPVVRDMLPSP